MADSPSRPVPSAYLFHQELGYAARGHHASTLWFLPSQCLTIE